MERYLVFSFQFGKYEIYDITVMPALMHGRLKYLDHSDYNQHT